MILVTGGSGYLGSHLARALLDRGESVRVLDLRPTKYLPGGVQFLQGDLRDRGAVRSAVGGARRVFHLAFVQSLSRLPELERWEINFEGSRNLLEACLEAGVERIVYASTIEVYGTRPPFPCPEEAPKDEPVGWYGRHKWEVEKLVWAYHREKGLQAAAVRMPTICGPGYYNHRPTLLLMDRILKGRPVAVIGNGSTLGDFVHLEDVLQGFLLAGERREAAGESFNISCRESSSHLEIVQAMVRQSGSRSRIFRVPRPLAKPLLHLGRALGVTDLPPYQFDYLLHPNAYAIEKARRLLGYRPRFSAAEAAAELIRGYALDRDFVRRRSESY